MRENGSYPRDKDGKLTPRKKLNRAIIRLMRRKQDGLIFTENLRQVVVNTWNRREVDRFRREGL